MKNKNNLSNAKIFLGGVAVIAMSITLIYIETHQEPSVNHKLKLEDLDSIQFKTHHHHHHQKG